MSKKTTSKYSVLNSGALYDLAAELESQKEKLNQQHSGSGAIKGLKRDDGKKPSKWAAPSKGLAGRLKRQAEQESLEQRAGKVDKASLESSKGALERKAKIYEELKRGRTGGLSERQLAEASVDWDQKVNEPSYSSDSSFEHSDDDAPGPSGARPDDDDPLTDYEDNLGRTRAVPRSQVPAYALDAKRRAKLRAEPAPENLIYGDHQYYPVYEPSVEELQARLKAAEGEPVEKHYDGNAEVRNKSAAFYQFSSDVDERTRQIAELKAAHLETEAARQSVEIPLPFTSSTNRPPPPPPKVFGGKASEKRKRELDERRALLEARKRKKEASEVEDLFSAISKDLSSDLI